MTTRTTGRTALSLGTAALFAATATAAQEAAPRASWLSGGVAIEIQNDHAYSSDDPGNERNDLYTKTEPELTLHVPPVPGLSFHVHGVLEPVADPDPGEDRVFEDLGFFVEDLYASYEIGAFGVRAGKLNPGFGIAWDLAPGVYGTDMAEDYEMTERVGVTGSYTLDRGAWGTHTVTAGTFFLDTSPLSHSIASTSRGTTRRSDGGVSNTEDFSSYNFVLDGGGFGAAPDFTYHIGYIRQAHGVDGTGDETGFALGAANVFDLGGGFGLIPLVEVVWFDNSGGTADRDRTYWTGALQLTHGGWNAGGAYTRRDTSDPGAATVEDRQLTFSVGYAFDFGMGVNLGWKRLEEDGVETRMVGLLLTYGYEF